MGHGSRKQDYIGDLMITFQTSLSKTDLKSLHLGNSRGTGRVKESLLESLILFILSERKSHKTVGKNLSESQEKEVLFKEQSLTQNVRLAIFE